MAKKCFHYYWNKFCVHCGHEINKGSSVDGTVR